ncbi:hypothetical protein [Siminovitchia sp. 179-K 8D1 HS]|uniref:hypothetical protein n=1 Tax=Siminovitchia sp. 179-K 8D1 HS TaxID=3142385 RepID=UPI0039A14F6A
MTDNKQYQNGLKQYQMPKALRNSRKSAYRVGYTASTGNDTGSGDEPGKRTDL